MLALVPTAVCVMLTRDRAVNDARGIPRSRDIEEGVVASR